MSKLESIKWFAQCKKAVKFLERGWATGGRHAPVKRQTLSRIWAYGLAGLTTVLAWLADLLLGNRFNHSSGGLYIAAAFISTWFGGLGPGLLAIALTTAINLALFDHPDLALAVGVHGLDPLLFFVVVAVLVIFIKHHQKLADVLNSELEDKVEKRTAALNDANQRLEAFCYTLAHDLRAPLRSIQGFADLVITDYATGMSQECKDAMERIKNSADRMGRLVLDLLAYARLTREDFRKQTVDLEKVWQAALQTFADEITDRKAEVSSELRIKYVQGDPIGVERILVNLLGNALRFAHPERAPRVRLFSESNHTNVRIALEDNGIGLDPKYGERIFGLFECLGPTKGSGGTGVGLAIVKRCVETMGGRTGVVSTPGDGSCFWFELPEVEAGSTPFTGE
jgi:signal transduction histidine kinase